ncbi:hypothetical protein DZF91_33550 [Actinomadura logoneensis]|uniref:Carrier domain-containing protein n=1 Tax=Actinomadura logoneensis TaxID=2293572 RepID=A0A372JBG2_9ACTN|nr:hypothetical protein [Actinomadura logoneensis]RFU37310.1 hypothetical protein DZF91_33550 [Actinomadura logoneensis]
MTDADTRTGPPPGPAAEPPAPRNTDTPNTDTRNTDTPNTAGQDTHDAALRERVEALVVIATGRVVSVADLRAAGGSLVDAGVNSIAFINLLEALERLYQVEPDTERDPEALATVDGITHLIRSAAPGAAEAGGGDGEKGAGT